MIRTYLEKALLVLLKVLGFAFFTVVVVFPFYWLFLTSVQPMTELITLPPTFWVPISEMNFSFYPQLLFELGFIRYMRNSAVIATITVLFTLILATMGAYAVTRLRFKGKQLMSRGILLVYMFPAIVLVVPLFVMFSWLGLRDAYLGLIIVYVAQTTPVGLYMLKSYFETLPVDLEEAALIDGCSRWSVIWRVTIPLSLPSMATVALYTFMIAWNEFLFAFIFLDTPSKFTLSRGVVQLSESIQSGQQFLAAAAVIVTVPIITMFFLFQRYLVKGLTAGGVKG